MPFLKPLLLFCLIAWSSLLMAQPCTDQWVYPSICSDDTLVLYAPACSNCSYSWTVPPLNGNNGTIAKYLFPNDPAMAHSTFSYYFLDVEVTDSNQNCTWTFHQEAYQTHVEDIDILALDGAWGGSTFPQRYAISYYDDLTANYVQTPTWQVTGGTIVQTQSYLDWMAWPFPTRTDTIHVLWNPTGPWQLDLTMNTMDQRNSWPNFNTFNCDAMYEKRIGPDGTIRGDTAVCPQGDTLSYTVAASPSFSYNWVVTGGTLLSGQSTDSVVVAWPANANGTLQANVTFNSFTHSKAINVVPKVYPGQFLRPDLISCTPSGSVFLDARDANGQEYLWSTAETSPTISIFTTGIYYVDVVDTGCGIVSKDTFEYFVLPTIYPDLGPDTVACSDGQLTLSVSSDFSDHYWSTSSTDSTLTITQPGQYWLSARDSNGCFRYDTIQIGLIPDCVFPGDADYDGTANNFDVLAIGANFGSAGLPRSNANLQWLGQVAPDWVDTLTATVNMKQVDTDGNAVVNADDTLAIALNYGFTHSKTQAMQTSGVPLNIRAGFDSVLVGDTAVYHISLGDSLTPADSVYGVAFTINYDTALTDSNGLLYTDFSSCWIAPAGACLSFSYDRYPAPHADIAIVRTDGQDTSGFGDLCRVGFVTIDNISGKRNTLYEPFRVSISDILFIDKDMNAREAAGGMDSTIVVEEGTRIQAEQAGSQLEVYPLPGDQTLYLDCGGEGLEQVQIFDLSGKLLLSGNLHGESHAAIQVGHLPPGIYGVEVRSVTGGLFRKKALLMR